MGDRRVWGSRASGALGVDIGVRGAIGCFIVATGRFGAIASCGDSRSSMGDMGEKGAMWGIEGDMGL